MGDLSPIPRQTSLIQRKWDAQAQRSRLTGVISPEWDDWFVEVASRINNSPVAGGSKSLTTQEAAIVATPIPMASLPAGLYRVSYYARITRAATVSSSLTVTIGFTDGGANPSFSGTAMTGNTTATAQSNVWLIRSDNAGPITYATAYVSNGATAMQYALYLKVEALK